jgi:hypothetical protein
MTEEGKRLLPKPFKVYLQGSFWALDLYDQHGREIDNLQDAITQAETQHGPHWREVANGLEGISREEITSDAYAKPQNGAVLPRTTLNVASLPQKPENAS